MRRLLVCTALLATVPAAAAKPKVAVLDVTASGIEASLIPLLTEVLTVEVDALDRYQVVAGSDIRTLIGFEKQKDLFGCNDAACIAEIGGALGVDQIVVSNIGKLGATFVVNIKLIDIAKVETQGRIYESVQGEIDLLLDTIRRSVHRLFGPAPEPKRAAPEAKLAETPPSRSPAAEQAAPSRSPAAEQAAPAPAITRPVATQPVAEPPAAAVSASAGGGVRLTPILLWGAGALAFGAGTYFGLDARSRYDRATDVDVIGRQTEIDPGEQSQLIANIAFAAGAVAVSSGLAVWYFGGTPATVAVAPTSGGVSVVGSIAIAP